MPEYGSGVIESDNVGCFGNVSYARTTSKKKLDN